MSDTINLEDLDLHVEAVWQAFNEQFERFRCFLVESDSKYDEGLQSTWESDLSLPEKASAALKDLQNLDTQILGKKGEFNRLKPIVGRVREELQPNAWQKVQRLRTQISEPLQGAKNHLEQFRSKLLTRSEAIDVTLPGRRPRRGHLHPITLLCERIEDIFVSLGYAIEDGREIETDFFNFEALNIPQNHPARAAQDTFYTTEGFALRSQTSTVQIHAMQRRGAPVRMIAPGRVFRRDTPDPTHNPMFFQVEGLCVDRGISMAHLKGTVAEFLRRMFGPKTVTRFRPSYFPFTEPSAEFDFSCFKCAGAGCRICKQSGWIELGGSGMVHPNVLRVAGIDPEEFSGFAFGLGIDRMAALMYNLDDIRLLFENDVRFLEQFD